MRSERVAVRIYRTLMGMYPRRFRDDHASDMVQLMRDQFGDEPVWRVCGRAAIDLAITIPTQQLEAHMSRTPTRIVPLLYTAISAGGLLLALVGGTNTAMLVIGLCVALVSGVAAAVAWRRTGPIDAAISTSAWWKFVLAGPCIVAAVIIAAGIGVEEWFLGVLAVFVAFALTATGLLLGVARLSSRRSRSLPA